MGATACAGGAARDRRARAPRERNHRARALGLAPLPRLRFAVFGPHGGEVERMARHGPARTPADRKREHRAMVGRDAELELLRTGVSCAAVLERLPPAWNLDRKESTRRALKYRRGEGKVVIVNHDGRGWWDPLSSAKGDVFDLVQFLDPSLNFGQVRQVLRPFVGVSPTYPKALRAPARNRPDRPLSERWAARPRLRRGTPAWSYLADARCLTPDVLDAAAAAEAVREGPYESAWFAHRDGDGVVSHIEIRGPDFKGSVRGGNKTLFELPGGPGLKPRIVLTEAPIDALSVAALEGIRPDTAYLATGGGMGPGTVQAIERVLAGIAHLPDALLASAADANAAGERYAARHAELAASAGIAFARLIPTIGVDWNHVLKQERGS